MRKTKLHDQLNKNFQKTRIGQVNRYETQYQGSETIQVGGMTFKNSFGESFLFFIDELLHEKVWKYKFCIIGLESSRVVHSDVYSEEDFFVKINEFFKKLS